MQAEGCTGFEPPLALLASSVRNASEAAALVDIDILALRHEVLHDHLLACCAHEHELEQARCKLARVAADGDQQLVAASALCMSALATVRGNIELLVTEADEVLCSVRESARTIRRYAESNEALAAELAEEGAPALAAAKQRLWLVEESLAHRMDSMLAALSERLLSHEELEEGASRSSTCAPDAVVHPAQPPAVARTGWGSR